MTTRTEALIAALQSALGDKVASVAAVGGEVTLVVGPDNLLAACGVLRDDPQLQFAQLTDLCGLDYSAYDGAPAGGARFAVVYHLLSITHNRRLRLRTFADDDELPVVASVTGVWPAADWYEREAFDLMGIVFAGHPDLRRILTDYGFVGHPFRKDFPLSGTVEMRYDPDQQRVIYQPVTIEAREIVPRTIREENYADVEKKH